MTPLSQRVRTTPWEFGTFIRTRNNAHFCSMSKIRMLPLIPLPVMTLLVLFLQLLGVKCQLINPSAESVSSILKNVRLVPSQIGDSTNTVKLKLWNSVNVEIYSWLQQQITLLFYWMPLMENKNINLPVSSMNPQLSNALSLLIQNTLFQEVKTELFMSGVSKVKKLLNWNLTLRKYFLPNSHLLIVFWWLEVEILHGGSQTKK